MTIPLYYSETGSTYPLILLHGNNEDSDYFKFQREYFSKTRRVIAVDTRGHGRSPRGEGEFSLSRFADDLKDFFDSLGLEKADILGFSDGANIALIFALRYPGYVNRLILNGANLFPLGVKMSHQLPTEIGYLASGLLAGRSEKALRRHEMLGLMVNEPNIGGAELKTLEMPVLVIAGTDDMIKERHTRYIARCIKNSRLVFIKGDHYIARKEPVRFNSAVEDFLGE